MSTDHSGPTRISLTGNIKKKKRAHSQKVWKNTNELVMYRFICIGKTQFIFIYHCMFTIVIHGGHYVMA
jgi:hypothetical protein